MNLKQFIVLLWVLIFVVCGQSLATGYVKICSHDGKTVTTTTYSDFIKNYTATFSICMYDEITENKHFFKTDVVNMNDLKLFVSNFYGGNVRNGERLLAILNQEMDMDQKILLYKFLFEEMQYYDDLYSYAAMILGYRVISLLRSMSADISLLYIIENLPDSIKKFPFNETVVVEVYHGYSESTKYLFSSTSKYDYNRNKIALSGPADRTKCPGCYWNMEPFDNGQAFRLLNTLTKEYLYADTNKFIYSQGIRWTFSTSNSSCIPGDGDTWQFEPIKNESFRYRIRNSYYEELLLCPTTAVVVTTKRHELYASTIQQWRIYK